MKKLSQCLLLALVSLFISTAYGRNVDVSLQTNVPLTRAIDDAFAAAEYKTNWTVMLGGGSSMRPYYGNGSVLLVSNNSYYQLESGMMAIFRDGDGDLVGHWLIRQQGEGWVTQGVNNNTIDPELMTQREYVGVIFGVLNSAGEDAKGLAYAQQLELPRVLGKSR